MYKQTSLYVIMTAAGALVPNRRQVINNPQADSSWILQMLVYSNIHRIMQHICIK